MISCTEFIPAYSELFTYLDEHYGRPELERFWSYLFAPTGKGIPLINFIKKDGLRGAWDYSCGTIKEEAADTTKYFNEKQGWIYNDMHYCPSKGRLLELQRQIGFKPYYDYCGHCNYYRPSFEQEGLGYIRNHINVDKAGCSSIYYDPKLFKGMIVFDENTEVMRSDPKKGEYYHPDFHSSMNMGIDFIAREHGKEALEDYLSLYALHVKKPLMDLLGKAPLDALEYDIRETYHREKAEDALTLEREGDRLSVKVAYCPAVKHLRKTGRDVSEWFGYTTETVMRTLAEAGGLDFEMIGYDKDTGAAEYAFRRC